MLLDNLLFGTEVMYGFDTVAGLLAMAQAWNPLYCNPRYIFEN